jgi:hypothetical protein
MTVDPYEITFLNYLGGFEYFYFTAKKEYQILIDEVGETTQNILPAWPQSWGENADTIRKQTFRRAANYVIVRSQYLSVAQVEALKYIRISPLVQLVYSRINRRTVIVDSDSFKVYDEKDKTFSMEFKIRFTDDLPSQRL